MVLNQRAILDNRLPNDVKYYQECFSVGLKYYNGEVFEQNYKKALMWFEKSAEGVNKGLHKNV